MAWAVHDTKKERKQWKKALKHHLIELQCVWCVCVCFSTYPSVKTYWEIFIKCIHTFTHAHGQMRTQRSFQAYEWVFHSQSHSHTLQAICDTSQCTSQAFKPVSSNGIITSSCGISFFIVVVIAKNTKKTKSFSRVLAARKQESSR